MMTDNSSASGGSGSGDPHHNQSGGGPSSDPQGRKQKWSHRHTAQQIQRLDSAFNECPHPDETARLQLSRELDLTPQQIKFWFQNRRTHMKVQHDRADNCLIQQENERLRCETIAVKQAMKNVLCYSCGEDRQKLLMENAQLKEELERVLSIAAKYLGKPISTPDLTMSTNHHSHGMLGPQLPQEEPMDPDLSVPVPDPGPSTSVINPVSGGGTMDKSPMCVVAQNAMAEFLMLLQYNEPLWVKSPLDDREALNLEMYDTMFPRPNSSSDRLKNPNTRIESSRDSAIVFMNTLALVDMFMDVNKWVEAFPDIVSSATTLEVISPGVMGSQNGRLQLMYEELQVLSPLVPPRPVYFLRFCQQIEQTAWAIVDVSVEIPPENQFAAASPSCKTYRFPSGCLIQQLPPTAHSKVIWMEHSEIEQNVGVHMIYKDLLQNGTAFGAPRWLASLHRICDRHFSLDLGGTSPPHEGKRSLMNLAQRLVTSFCATINPSDGHQWTTISGPNEYDIRAMVRGVILSAATTIWLPINPQRLFHFLLDEKTRHLWDIFTNQNPVEEFVHIANGSNFENGISVMQPISISNDDMLILQESCVDSSGSLMVVYGQVHLTYIKLTMSGEDPSNIYLLPSGFAISPDGCNRNTGSDQGASSSSGGISGSLVTVVLQICVGNLPSANMSPETENVARNLIESTVPQIKAAFN